VLAAAADLGLALAMGVSTCCEDSLRADVGRAGLPKDPFPACSEHESMFKTGVLGSASEC